MTFRVGLHGPITADVDFLQEVDNPTKLVFELIKPLHVESEPGPDLAFFEVEVTSGSLKLAAPIELAAQVAATDNVATIGYPAYDSRIPEADLMETIFGKIYNKKRLAPGSVTNVEQTRVLHNCTTLGGNSGSAVVDLDTGQALGLHFSGSFLATNYAVRADIVKNLLARVRSGHSMRRSEVRRGRPTPARQPLGSSRSIQSARLGSASVTIPLTVTVSIGDISERLQDGQRYRPSLSPVADGGDTIVGNEAIADDYRDRIGYQPNFLGSNLTVDLPLVQRDAEDVLNFEFLGKSEIEVRYEHYSVVMSRSRRMCFFSAVNIDGNRSKKSARVGWKWDPRIPKGQQIMNECYGSPPKFSRGHMTRREDPGWGDAETAKRGNEDFNARHQCHATNSGIQRTDMAWTEDYALSHAREDDMKISVFTGPYFDDSDPEMYGVRIPLAFWKIIAFVHDETGELCATGYEMNQETTLQDEKEFVFGAFISPQLNVATQISIRSIETRSGISFGRLASVDPLFGSDEGLMDGDSGLPSRLSSKFDR